MKNILSLLSRFQAGFGALVVVAALAACGGGGGSSPTPNVPSGNQATPTPTLTPATATVSGHALDSDRSNAPLVGATVQVGMAFTNGTISGVLASATTGPDGSYSIPIPLTTSLPALAPPIQPAPPLPQTPTPPPGTTNTFYVQVNAGTTMLPLHNVLYTKAGAVTAPDFLIAEVGTDDNSGLAAVNADRAQLGAGAGTAPLTLDSDLTKTARFVTQTMATQGFFSHNYPGTTNAVDAQNCTIGGFCGRYLELAENISEGGNIVQGEAGYIAEGPIGGHYQQVINPKNIFIGFGEALNANLPGNPCACSVYSAEEFVLNF